jgi:hypothetical protein
MTKIAFGKQRDKSKAEIDIHSDGRSNTNIDMGDQLDQSKRHVRIHDQAGGPASPSDTAVAESSAVWLKGSFFLVLLIVAAALFAVLARVLPWYAFPAVVLACVLVLYLFGLLLVPSSSIHERGFLKILSAFVGVFKPPEP